MFVYGYTYKHIHIGMYPVYASVMNICIVIILARVFEQNLKEVFSWGSLRNFKDKRTKIEQVQII
jgi:hypothetical protein